MGYCGMSFALCMWYLLIAAHIYLAFFFFLFFCCSPCRCMHACSGCGLRHLIPPLQEHIATEADIQDHRLLHRAIVMHESNPGRRASMGGAGTCEGPPGFMGTPDQNVARTGGICALDPLLPMEGGMQMVSMEPGDALVDTSKHSFVWGEELSTLGRQMLLAHASWHGIDELQLAAM